MTTSQKPTKDEALREAAEKVCRAWEADPTDPTAFGSAMDKSVADLQLSLSQPPAPEQIVCGGPGCDGECCQKEQAAEPDAPVAAKPDPQLCKFYQVETFQELVAAQSHHIKRLQEKLGPPVNEQQGKVREG